MIHSLIHQAPPHLNSILSYKELWDFTVGDTAFKHLDTWLII